MGDNNADKTVVLSVLSGNTEEYGEIVSKYKDIVFSSVYSMIKNYHTAEDIAQETFVEGYIKLESLGEPYNVGAWLLRIAKNKCYNYLTRSNVRFESELRDYIPDSKTFEPEEFFIAEYDKYTLERAVNKLPDLYKTVTLLYYFNNHSHKKIAGRLNIPIGTVKRRLYDARLKLKKEFDEMDIRRRIQSIDTIRVV